MSDPKTNEGTPPPATPTDEERLPGGLPRAQFLQLHDENPIAAAEYSRRHGVWRTNAEAMNDPLGVRAHRAKTTETPAEEAARIRDLLSWSTGKT